MEVKGDTTCFVIDPETILEDHANPERYKIIHPNFEVWEDFIEYKQVQSGHKVLAMHFKISEDPKAEYTYVFFRLKELAVDTFFVAQGGEIKPSHFREVLKQLA